MPKMRLQPGLCPDPAGAQGSLQQSPRRKLDLRGPTSRNGEGREKEGMEGAGVESGRGNEEEGSCR